MINHYCDELPVTLLWWTLFNQGRLDRQEASPELKPVMWCTDAPSSGEIGKTNISPSISYNTLTQSQQLTVVYQSHYLAAALAVALHMLQEHVATPVYLVYLASMLSNLLWTPSKLEHTSKHGASVHGENWK